jgi:hypothetical protein
MLIAHATRAALLAEVMRPDHHPSVLYEGLPECATLPGEYMRFRFFFCRRCLVSVPVV